MADASDVVGDLQYSKRYIHSTEEVHSIYIEQAVRESHGTKKDIYFNFCVNYPLPSPLPLKKYRAKTKVSKTERGGGKPQK